MNPHVEEVLTRIEARSKDARAAYVAQTRETAAKYPPRSGLSCANLAHAFAASGQDKALLLAAKAANIGIVTSYNDMLSAHQPLQHYPDIIKHAAREARATAQVAGATPAMCDGVTQGQAGMELSLISRDVIAMSTAIALTHNSFDAALMLGVCDKIIPGLFMGAAAFGHLPTLLVPAGPMPSGLPNAEKARIRKLHAEGKVGRDELLKAEADSYHAAGTCTFYGTANSNQMLMEVMGLHIPGAAFVAPNTPLRDALTHAATHRIVEISLRSAAPGAFGDAMDAKSFVNAIVGLNATGGSTNHAIHLVAMAASVGVKLNWDDFADLSAVTPLLCRIYPNGEADVNHFHAAGGMGFVMRELLNAGLMIETAQTLGAPNLRAFTQEPVLQDGALAFREAPVTSVDVSVLRPYADAFDAQGGLRLTRGNLGRAITKVFAVQAQHRVVEAPARVFDDQDDLIAAFKRGELDRDVVCVLRWQGPRANGMPELHKLTPALSSLQDRGFKVALVTDGRMSGASGKIPAAIHVTPEAAAGGPLAKVRDGDVILLDAERGVLEAKVPTETWNARGAANTPPLHAYGLGRDLFSSLRARLTDAEDGASAFA
jgi:phosphogluconate dehydratase